MYLSPLYYIVQLSFSQLRPLLFFQTYFLIIVTVDSSSTCNFLFSFVIIDVSMLL